MDRRGTLLDDVWPPERIKNGEVANSAKDNLTDNGRVRGCGKEKTEHDEEYSERGRKYKERRVMDKTVDADETRRRKAKELRYRKPIVSTSI